MAALGKSAKSNLFFFAFWDYSCENDHLDTSNTKVCVLVMTLSTVQDNSFSSFFVIGSLADDHIMSGRLIWSLRHPKLKNHLIIQDSIDKVRMVQHMRMIHIQSYCNGG